jgi:hypothetical protein
MSLEDIFLSLTTEEAPAEAIAPADATQAAESSHE